MEIKWSMRSVWHYIIGLFAGLSWVWSVSLPPTVLIGFIAYEWLQDKNIRRNFPDRATDSHKDIYEAVFALPFGVGLGAGLRFLGIL